MKELSVDTTNEYNEELKTSRLVITAIGDEELVDAIEEIFHLVLEGIKKKVEEKDNGNV